MEWDSSYNQPVAIAIVFAFANPAKRCLQDVHNAIKRMDDGLIKRALSHQFHFPWQRRTEQTQQIGIVRPNTSN
jgi:hypothetical protein